MQRRRFVGRVLAMAGGAVGVLAARETAKAEGYDASKHTFGMGVQVDKCIGCGRCVEACKTENDVPRDPFFTRTWVEQYTIRQNGEVVVRNIDNPQDDVPAPVQAREVMRSFFVPKLCNQCEHPPCVQVCPVGATFKTEDGVILVDERRCIGCRYCIQACPYGARYLHPDSGTADKCTFCYHRITRDLLPACVEVCPTQARIFGDLRSPASPLTRFRRMNKLTVLKSHLNTEPKVSYSNLDGEVR